MHHPDIIGIGGERSVRPDPSRPDAWVRKESHAGYERSSNEAKAVFYLTKVLHLLHPKTIPDIHQAGSSAVVVDRKELGPEHELANEEIRRYEMGEDVSPEFLAQVAQAKQKILQNPSVRDFVASCERYGLLIDDAAVNFGIDSEGHAVFVDTVDPWRRRKDGAVSPQYDDQALRNEVVKLEVEQKETGLKWLDRLEHLLAEENERVSSNRKLAS